MFFSLSPLRQTRDQTQRAHLLSGHRGGLLRSPAQRHKGNPRFVHLRGSAGISGSLNDFLMDVKCES